MNLVVDWNRCAVFFEKSSSWAQNGPAASWGALSPHGTSKAAHSIFITVFLAHAPWPRAARC
jgi:hypothetical protein